MEINIRALIAAICIGLSVNSNVKAALDVKAEEIYLEEHVRHEDVVTLAKLVYGEAGGVPSTTEQSAVIWCVLNRVDAGIFGDSIYSVVTSPYQFTGYRESNPVTDELYNLSEDVLERWYLEKAGYEDVGRTLPKDYLYFHGSGGHNHFRQGYRDSVYWDWSLPSPYDD